MKEKSHLSIKEFSRLTGIKSPNLRFYDQIGLLSPDRRGENGYRYYSRHQLNTGYLIVSLRELGIGLEEIRRYAEGRTPEGMLALFKSQEKRIDAEMAKLRRLREIMDLNGGLAREALRYAAKGVRVVVREREPIFLGPLIPPGRSDEEGVLDFYDLAAEQGLEAGHPMGVWVERAESLRTAHCYFKVKRGENAFKPAGRYAVAYGQGGHERVEEVLEVLRAYLAQQGLRGRDEVYVEYPLSELAVRDEAQFCVKVEIPLEE